MPLELTPQQPPYYTVGDGITTKYYNALITQIGTAAPTVTELKNTLDATLTYSYTTIGTYKITASANNTFPVDKTEILMGPPYAVGYEVYGAHNEDINNKEIFILTALSGTEANEILYKTAISIIVYP